MRDVLDDGGDVRERVNGSASSAPVTLAAFGGVYSNRYALDAVLDDLAARGADHVWCLGDLGGFGPTPDAAIERLRAEGVPTLRGNMDDSVGHDSGDCDCGYGDPRDLLFSQRSFDYTAAHTSRSHKAWMRDLRERARLSLGGRRVLLCHGSPRRVNEFLWESTCGDAFLEHLCREHDADVLLCTHTGLPWHRALPSGRHVVNAGVIGRPPNDGLGGAVYASVTFHEAVTVRLHRVAYDHEALARDMERERLPSEFVETIRTGWWTTCLENLPARERSRGRH